MPKPIVDTCRHGHSGVEGGKIRDFLHSWGLHARNQSRWHGRAGCQECMALTGHWPESDSNEFAEMHKSQLCWTLEQNNQRFEAIRAHLDSHQHQQSAAYICFTL